MTAVQISVSRGASLLNISDFTVSTNVPGTGDIELRYNLLDTNSVVITRKDVILALKGFIRVLEQKDLITNSPIL